MVSSQESPANISLSCCLGDYLDNQLHLQIVLIIGYGTPCNATGQGPIEMLTKITYLYLFRYSFLIVFSYLFIMYTYQLRFDIILCGWLQ